MFFLIADRLKLKYIVMFIHHSHKLVASVRTQISNSPNPLRTMRFTQFNYAQINIFVRK